MMKNVILKCLRGNEKLNTGDNQMIKTSIDARHECNQILTTHTHTHTHTQ